MDSRTTIYLEIQESSKEEVESKYNLFANPDR